MATDITKIYEGVAADLHPEALTGTTGVIEAARHGLTAVYISLGETIHAEKQLRNIPDAGPQLFKSAYPVIENAVRQIDGSITAVNKIAADHQRAIDSNLAPKDAAVASEVRSYFRSLTPAKAHAAAIEAIRSGDIETTRAILTGPSYLSGLDRSQQTALHDIAASTFNPDQHLGLEEARKAKAKLEHSLATITKFARDKKIAWLPTTGALLALNELNTKGRQS